MNLIDTILDQTSEIETPRSYIRWATLAAISGIVGKKVWTEKYAYKVYPNIFVMLIGPPGITKSYATDISKKLVRATNHTRIISGMNSIEGIIETLGSAQIDEKGLPSKDGSAKAFIVASEFTNLLLDNPQAFSVLTDLYDACYGDEWIKTLKSGTVKLKSPYITMITATNTAHFNDKLRQVDIEGGFIGRTIVILEKNRHCINSLIRKPNKTFDLSALMPELKRISQIAGEFTWANEQAMKYFEEWDYDFKTKTKTDTTGIYKRMNDTVIKVAMLMSIADGDELCFTKNLLEKAIHTCTDLVTNIKSVTAGSGEAANSQAMMKFMRCLIDSDDNRMDHNEMLRRNYQHFDVYEMAKIVETLEEGKIIRVEKAGSKKYYVMTDKAIGEFLKGKES